ncbi:hypothetical protein PR048_010741 [Dryococelus australis]|uniref:BED-type domain-containing protein n=1 Tax=Dryococelus australis TaxID=614101 RepID=A0ABQ9I3L1_9NEOP|nr:hypothetical protein PR048_010741 [Dryococelus australis]
MSPRRTSDIWNHFGEVPGEQKPRCCYCSQEISFVSWSIGNLRRHMKNRHPRVNFSRVEVVSARFDDQQHGDVNYIQGKASSTKNQTDITNFVTINKPLPVKRSTQIDKQLVRMVVEGYQPFSLVEDEEFKNFVHMFSPGYHLPTRKTLSTSLIPRLYLSVREQVTLKMNEASAVCMTTDNWTSINNKSFVAETVHFVDRESKLSTILLDCISFNERRTAENLNAQLRSIAEEWGIDNKIVVVVTDNAPNINLIVQSSWQTISAIEKIKTIVEFFKRSSSALAKLKSTQEQMGLLFLKLIHDVLTHWNLTYDMMSRILKIKAAVISTLAIVNPELNVLTVTEWDILQRAAEVLHIFSEVTTEISAEKSFYKSMCGHVTECSVSGQAASTRGKQLKKCLKDCESNELYAQTKLLDPRFKNSASPTMASMKQHTHIVATASHSQSSLWKSFDMTVQKLTQCDPTAAAIVETGKYMQEPLLNRHGNPLVWWCDRKCLYPRLYELVQRRLCIIPTSLPCERIFPKAGQTLTERRNCPSSSKTSELLFLHSNMK